MRQKYYLCIILFVLNITTLYAQQQIPANEVFNQPLVDGTYNYKATQSISLRPGFSYKPTKSGNILTATIDPLNLNPNPFPNNIFGGVASGVVGKIKDNFAVTPTGQVSYEIPIIAPPGTGGMSPQLAIVYNSSSRDGLLGSGFDLSGLSMINRAPSNLHTDGTVGLVNFSSTDKFMLDGQRLILLKSINNNTFEYRTENNAFSKIIATGGDISNPSTFTVHTKDGLIYQYVANTSPLKSVTTDGKILFWLLKNVTDTKGNYFTISYDRDDINGEYWPTRMDYTGNTNTGLAPYNSIRFDYEINFSPSFAYVYGKKVQKSKILNKISIYSGEKKIKYYNLSYSTVNFKYQLNEVTEYASDGTKTNPTKFDWYNVRRYNCSLVDNDETALLYKADIHTGDFNGDGKIDFLATPKSDAGWSGWRLFLSEGTSFKYAASGSLVNSDNIKQIVIGDFNGDGYADFVINSGENNNLDLYLTEISSGGNINLILTKEKFYSTGHVTKMSVGEFNGDGISDLFTYFPYEDFKPHRIFYGESQKSLFNSYRTGLSNMLYENQNEIIDFNGDGLSDIAKVRQNKVSIEINIRKGALEEFDHGGFTYYQLFGLNKERDTYFGDFNGDGKTDMLTISPEASTWDMYYSTGNEFEKRTIENPPFVQSKDDSKKKTLFISDINGDGVDDFFVIPKSIEGDGMSAILSYISNGTSLTFNVYAGGRIYGLDKSHFNFGDFDGDGRIDVLSSSNWDKSSSTGYQLFLTSTGPSNILRSITDGLGNKIEVSYKTMNDKTVHEKGITNKYPLVSFNSSWLVVDQVSRSNGIGGMSKTSYTYKNALLHKLGRGVLGFEYFTEKDEATGIETTSQFEVNTEQYIMGLKSTETKLNGKILGKVEYTNTLKYYEAKKSYENIFTFDVTKTKEYKYEYNTGALYSTIETNMNYDDYGNVILSETIYDKNTKVTNVNRFDNNETKWHLGRLRESIVTKTKDGKTATRTSKFDYKDDSGLLYKEIVEENNVKYGYIKTYVHDSFGNITESTTTPNDKNFAPRTQKSKYDPAGRFEIESIDYLGFVTKRDINYELGVVNYEIDPNGIKTTYSYDGMGQVAFVTAPLANAQTKMFWSKGHADAPANAIFFSYTEKSGSKPAIEFFDALGRSIRKVITGFDGKTIYQDVVYNSKGQAEKSSEPYFKGETVYWNTNQYDDIGRTIKQLFPDGSSSSVAYDGLTTTLTNQSGQKNTRKMDLMGNLVESIDNLGGKVTYTYNVNGNCEKVVGPRTTIITEYDIMGNRIKLIDPDLGTVEYDYNAYGELISQKDANGTRTMKYDNAGRIVQEVNKEGTTTYTYDTLRKGMLTSISLNTGTATNNTSQTMAYDSYGRVTRITEVIGTKSYVTETTYDTFNRVSKITYPSGLAVTNTYNDYGYLKDVRNASTAKAYWTAKKMNARGQLEEFTLGNNLTTTTKYSPQRGLITNISTPGIQDWTYQFNAIGNLESRKDNLRQLTEKFEYDGLDRLWKTYHNNVLKEETRYDAAGNLTYKTGVGTKFEYEDGTNRLLKVSGGSYEPKNWDEIRYASFNKIIYVKDGTNTLQILYGYDKQRKRAITMKGTDQQTRYYVGSLYEEEYKSSGEVIKRHHIFANGGSIAIVENSSLNKETTRYLHKDHLGSIQAISDESGRLVQELSYDAWGRRRSAINWEFIDLATANAFTDRGFTGHEHIDLFEMINMNGRMYDPMLGRFLNPDPYVQAPDFTQGLNRYIYCLNNPLSLVDPSGYSWFSQNWKSLVSAIVGITVAALVPGGQGIGAAMLAGALGGAAAGLAGALLNGANFQQAIKATLTGGFWGAVGGGLAFLSSGGTVIERMLKHAVNQGALEGVRGGNFIHGFMAGAAAVGGGAAMGKWGSGWGKAGKVAANAVISGTVAELGGGKFANGAITGAYVMLFNDMMHAEGKAQKKTTTYTFKRIGQVPLDEEVGMQMATYTMKVSVTVISYENGDIQISVDGNSMNTPVEGDVNPWIRVSLSLNGKSGEAISLEQHYSAYYTNPNVNVVGEAYFNMLNTNKYNQISVEIKAGWNVEVSPGHWAVPMKPTIIGTILPPIMISETHKIK